MTSFSRRLALSTLAACFALTLGAAPASAKTKHKHHVTHHARHIVKHSNAGSVIRIAQQHLANLGYYSGKIDGLMGPRTKAAIKHFQKEHSLKPDGVLGPKTKRALDYADRPVSTTREFPVHEAVPIDTTSPINPEFANSLNGGTKIISSRFARLDVNETGFGADKHYNVNVNGQPILTVDGQPSVIGISPTYDLGSEDAVIFTTYSPNDPICAYKNHVLAMDATGAKLLDIDNCTRAFQARVDGGSLYISFPEAGENRAVGAVWRLEGTSLERL